MRHPPTQQAGRVLGPNRNTAGWAEEGTGMLTVIRWPEDACETLLEVTSKAGVVRRESEVERRRGDRPSSVSPRQPPQPMILHRKRTLPPFPTALNNAPSLLTMSLMFLASRLTGRAVKFSHLLTTFQSLLWRFQPARPVPQWGTTNLVGANPKHGWCDLGICLRPRISSGLVHSCSWVLASGSAASVDGAEMSMLFLESSKG